MLRWRNRGLVREVTNQAHVGMGLLRAKRDALGLWKADGSGPFCAPEPREVQGCALLFEGGGMRVS